MPTSLTFAERFAGPPFATNGGHLAGVLAELAGLTGGHVQLNAPVPLETPVDVEGTGTDVALRHLGETLATVSPVSLLDMSSPDIDLATAEAAARKADPAGHPFPRCYVCGPERPQDDGLHLLPGVVDPGVVATVWEPTVQQAHGCGRVPLRVVVAALDCPSAFAFLRTDEAALLATMTFGVRRLPRVGERLIVTGALRRTEGRKSWATTVVSTPERETVARAENLWIQVDKKRVAMLEAGLSKVAA